MSLSPGTRLGPYEIVSPIGAGGMGEVYRAKDTRLERDVALKVLPEVFARDPERRARFEREAKAVAALSHPNIVAIFDIGEIGTHDGQIYVVMELLDGQTLREHSAALPVRKVIEAATQMLRGLAAAHEKGIVHRDLKPENVFVLKDGQVKILDFGLARQASASTGATETMAAMTDPGTVLGTMGYMAPEQIRGQAVDARTDLFAFGCVLYEMLSGRRAFARDTSADTMSAILKEDPPELAGSRPDFSPALDRIVRHCLEKNPAERFQTARDVAFALEALSGSGTAAPVAATAGIEASRGRNPWRTIAAVATIVAVAGTVGGFLYGRGVTKDAVTAISFERKTFQPTGITNARFMPDGKTIVYSTPATNGMQLFVLRPDSVTPQPQQSNTHLLSVSSKGELAVIINARQWNARVYTGTLARMQLDGAPRPWMENVREADWSPDGSTLAITRVVGNTWQIEYPIGTVLYESTGYVSDPRVSPDGTKVAFMDHQLKGDDRGWVKVVDAAKHVVTLAGEYRSVEGLAWSPDGSTVMYGASAATADMQVHAVNVVGPRPPRVALATPGRAMVMDVATDGRMLTVESDMHQGLMLKTPDAAAERDFTWMGIDTNPALSPDGTRLLFTDGREGTDYSVAIRKLDGSPAIRLGPGGSFGWSADGSRVAGLIASTLEIVVYPTGAGEPVKIPRAPLERVGRVEFFPDGKSLLVCGSEPLKPVRCYRFPVDGGPPTPVTPESWGNGLPSPDGKNILARQIGGSTYRLIPVDGSTPVEVKGLDGSDGTCCWSRDGKSVLVWKSSQPFQVERLILATGQRTLVRTVLPPDRSGATWAGPYTTTDDGRTYAYAYGRAVSTIFVVTGVR